MKNNKAFTLVEMLVSFTLAMILVIIMFQLIINLKELYMSSGIKTEMINKQYLMTNKIYTDLNEKKAINIENCNNPLVCIQFTFQDGTVKKLQVDETNKTVTYDNYTIKLNNESYFKTMNINTYYSAANNKIFNANIPIYNDLFKNTDFGINIVYPYNDTEVTNNYGNKYVPPMESYISLPYIKTNGNQYINLNYAAKINTEIRLDMELIENINTQTDSNLGFYSIIGRDIIKDNSFTINFGGSPTTYKRIYYWLDKTTNAGGTTYYQDYNDVTSRSTLIAKSGKILYQNIETTVAQKTEDNDSNIILFGSYNTDTKKIESFNKYDTKVYGFQIYEGANLIMNLTPAKSRETNKIGLYDTVSKQFFISNGTSDFIYE